MIRQASDIEAITFAATIVQLVVIVGSLKVFFLIGASSFSRLLKSSFDSKNKNRK
jgi:hypothetical protein